MAPPYGELAQQKRVGQGAREPQCSCDLILKLAARSPVRGVLEVFEVDDTMLEAGRDELHRVVSTEPADWRVRLTARGASTDDLEQLLAIVRSADSHGYQLLEHLGLSCARLRRHIIERMRALGEANGHAARPTEAPRRSPLHRRTASASASASAASSTVPVRRRGEEPGEAATAARERSRVAPVPSARVQEASEPEVVAPLPAPEESRFVAIDPDALPPLHGRERDLARLADALGRRSPRAPLLVGPHGCGRSVLAAHLATIFEAPIYRLEAPRYDDEEGLRQDLRAIAAAGGMAIIDDLDGLPAEVAPAWLTALTQAWATGEPPVLTIVSPEGHARLQTWAPGALERIDVIPIAPLHGVELEAAVKSSAPRVLEQHGLQLAPDAKLGELTRWAERYLGGPAMPGRALDLLDLACARTIREGSDFVTRATWLDIVSERSGLTADRIELRGDQDVLDLEHRLARQVVGHTHAIKTIASLVRRNRAGFGSERPVCSTLLLGPSGVGKTELAKALAAALFDREDALVRLDMSEYSESHSVARVVGAPPGYVGHEQGGALCDPLLARPHCVVLLDEIEKAHRDVHQLLLQVFDEGRLTDGRGRTVDFRHAAIIMTSNLGADHFMSDGLLDEDAVLAAARAAFPVELWNRIEAPLVCQSLSDEEMVQICRRLAKASSERLFKERGIRFALADETCTYLIGLAGRDPSLGARPLRHLLTRHVEAVIADAVLRGQLRAGMQVQVHVHHGRIVLR